MPTRLTEFPSVAAYIAALPRRDVRLIKTDLKDMGNATTQNAFTNAMREAAQAELDHRGR